MSATGEGGASTDTTAIADAADDYQSGDARAAAELADAASAADAVPMTKTKAGLKAESSDGAIVTVSEDGDTTLSSPGTPAIGLSVAGDAESTKVIDGTLVQSGVAPSTDIVTRATGDGVQMVAVLGDATAPTTVSFPLELPASSRLVPQQDGSIAVIAPTTVEQAVPGEEARIDAAIAAVLGPDAQGSDAMPTEDQLDALDSIPPARTEEVTQMRQIATIAAPWAVDANGKSLETRYILDGDTVKQQIETDQTTAFPVTADPEWWWWVATGVACVVQISGFLFAAAKLVGLAAKITKLIKASATLTKLVERLGGAKAVIQKIYDTAKGWAEGRATKYISAAKLDDLKTLLVKGKDLVFDLLGIGSCVALLTTR